jgi:ABC-2 type transport system permease protein
MRYMLLIALREFAENAKTKGFWIGIFTLPLIMAISIGVSGSLARAEPSRYFVVADQSGAFAEPIEHSIEWAHQRSVLQALGQYVRANLRAGQYPDIDLSGNQTAVETFIAAGGKNVYLARLRPMLRENAPEFKEPARAFVRVDLPKEIDADASAEAILAQLKPYLIGDRRLAVDGGEARLFAALLIEPGAVDEAMRGAAGKAAIQYWSTNLTVDNLPDQIRGALDYEVRRRLYVARGVDLATVREIEATRVHIGTFDPGKAEGTESVSTADRIARNVPVGFVYLLWISIFTVMQMLLNNTIEEKSNRIAEVLLSSVTPNEIMLGKLLGIAAVGLTMVGTWLATVFTGLQLYQGAGAEVIGPALDAVAASGLIPIFLLCFLLGYLIYAGLFLSAGALCNDLKEAQNLQGPIMLIMMVPLFTMVFVNRDPHGTLATILTWIPLYTPFTMMNRAAADPPLVELMGATLLMIVTALLLLWSAGRIFRIGMLRTGNRPKLAEIMQWIRGRADA